VGAALWCLTRFNVLERERLASRRGSAARLRRVAISWAGTGAILSGAATCLLIGAAFAATAHPGLVAPVLYTAICAGVLALVAVIETLTFAFRAAAAKEPARRRRKTSVRTLMRAAPHSQAPF
jgi:Flp pilus assembly protein protease CpaA